MVEIERMMNDRVMLVLNSHEGLNKIGIAENHFYAKLVGYDRIGLWIENPEFTTTRVRDDDGHIIPPEKRNLSTATQASQLRSRRAKTAQTVKRRQRRCPFRKAQKER